MEKTNGKRTFWTLVTDVAMSGDNQCPEFMWGIKFRLSGWCFDRIGSAFFDGSHWRDRSKT